MGRADLDFASQMRFGDAQALQSFALSHRLAHSQIASSIASELTIASSSFDVADARAHAAWTVAMLKPKEMPKSAREALTAWLLLHDQMHQSEYDAIGQSKPYDLSAVDFSDQGAFYDWMQYHQQMHDAESDALGITT